MSAPFSIIGKNKTILYSSGTSAISIKVLFIALTLWTNTYSQKDQSDNIAKVVYLDSVVVLASQSDFSVRDFIELVQNDVSFYNAFRNLRSTAYEFETQMTFFDRKNLETASYHALHRQMVENSCRWQQNIYEQVNGNLFKRKGRKENFYTFSLYDRLFLTHDTLCGITHPEQVISFEGKGMEGHVGELKKLIFAPGMRSDVPLIGDKTEIFSEKMMSRYEFFIRSEKYQGSIDAYIFEARLKPAFVDEKNNKTVIKELVTYFAKSDFQVLGRTYRLAHFKALYRFNVSMSIDLLKRDEVYFPAAIQYEGFWNVPTKKKETGEFTIEFTY